MNKQSFIERLNLYLDEELSEEESEELLQAVRENPEYHQIYVQYCQLFNACSQLGEKFAETPQTRPWRQKLYAYGGMAAAFALLFLAARNLSPFLDGMAEGGLAESGVNPVEDVLLEPVMLVDVTKEESLLLSDLTSPVELDLQPVSSVPSVKTAVVVESEVAFAGLSVSPKSEGVPSWVRDIFRFDDALRVSTIEHEDYSTGDEAEPGFDVRAIGSAKEEAFDLKGAAATAPKPNQ